MRDLLLTRLHLSSTLFVSLLVLSTQILWAQRTSAPEPSAVQLPDAPSRAATVSEAQTSFHLTSKGLPLSPRQNRGQTQSWMRFLSDETGYDHLSISANALLNQEKAAAEFWGKNKGFLGGTPTKRVTLAPAFGHVHYETTHSANDLEYYGRHLPWAGSVILLIGQQARAHPHVTTVLKTVHPQF